MRVEDLRVNPVLLGYLDRAAGRDKLFRLIQYAAMLSRWALRDNGIHHKADTGSKTPYRGGQRETLGIERLCAVLFRLERSMSDSRKVWRLLRFVDVYDAMLTVRGRSPLVTALLKLKLAVHSVYFLADNLVWLAKMELLPLSTETLEVLSRIISHSWMWGIVLGVVHDVLVGKTDRIAYLHYAFEFPLASSLVFRQRLNAGLIALLGLCSSFTGILQVVAKVRRAM